MSKASAYFTVESISGNHDVKELKRELDTLHGVFSVSVNELTDNIAVDFDTSGVEQRQIQKIIENLGYDVVSSRFEQNII